MPRVKMPRKLNTKFDCDSEAKNRLFLFVSTNRSCFGLCSAWESRRPWLGFGPRARRWISTVLTLRSTSPRTPSRNLPRSSTCNALSPLLSIFLYFSWIFRLFFMESCFFWSGVTCLTYLRRWRKLQEPSLMWVLFFFWLFWKNSD